MNASAWRVEPEQVVSDMTTRLLTWMSRARGGIVLEADEVAVRLHDALRELIDAQSLVVLVRRPPSEDFALLAATGIDAEVLLSREAGEDAKEHHFKASALLSVIPQWPFFPSEAPASAQVLLAELGDYICETCTSVGGTCGFGAAGMASSGGLIGPVRSPAPTQEIDSPTLVVPLLAGGSDNNDGEVIGLVLLWIATADGTIPSSMRAPLEAAALQGGGWLADALRLERVGDSYRKLGTVFGNAIDTKDVHRTGHSAIVAYYCALIARSMHLPEYEVERVEFAGMLHGIGKLAVPDSVLYRNETLKPEEREMIRAATVSGADWLRSVDGLQEVADMVRSQNERYDGAGYPDGLKGEEIPLGARILAVALRFASMTRPRADRRAMCVVGGAFEALAEDSGKSLDPNIVGAFLASMGRKL